MTDTPNNTAEINTPSADWLTPELVKDYLLNNPEFFIRYPLLAEELKIPHQKKGSVSLVELQAEQLREKVAELQKKLTDLMSVARQNEAIYRIYADLNLRLFNCKKMADIRNALQDTVCQQLKLSDVVLHLVADKEGLSDKDRQLIVDKRLSKSDFFFGRLTKEENQILFSASQPQSVAIMRLRHEDELGLLVIGSDNDGHFNPQMDTLLITQLQQFLSLIIPNVQD